MAAAAAEVNPKVDEPRKLRTWHRMSSNPARDPELKLKLYHYLLFQFQQFLGKCDSSYFIFTLAWK